MDYNILIGGAAGQGMETLAAILEKLLQRKGYEIFTIRDYMSRVRGGHNFIQIRFGTERLYSHRNRLDGIIALNTETIELHSNRLVSTGIILCDEDIKTGNPVVTKYSLKAAAKEAGNQKAEGSAALGVLFSLFGFDDTGMEEVFREFFSPDLAAINSAAFQKGRQLERQQRFEIKPVKKEKNLLINGNQAIAFGAMAADCKFYSAYPMTPSTSIMNYIASKMHEAEIVVEQAEDEIAAINMAIGASYAGARAMTGTSGGGFCLMVEALGLSAMQEVPIVVANIQRPGPTTGLPTRTEQGDLKFIVTASQGEFPRMIIAPRTPEDAFVQTARAFNMADKYQIPVILLGDQFLADVTTTIEPFDIGSVRIERHLAEESDLGEGEYKRYLLTRDGISPRIIPGKLPGRTVLVDSDEHDEYGHITESSQVRIDMNDKRLRKLESLSKELEEPEFLGENDFDTLLVAWGSMYGPVREALEILKSKHAGKFAALVFGDVWPLPQNRLKEMADRATRIINVEQNATGQLASIIREVTGITCTSSILRYDGRPMSGEDIVEKLEGQV